MRFLIPVVFVCTSFAQEGVLFTFEKEQYDPGDGERISRVYRSGEFLIYDCRGGFYACVNQQNYTACEEKRESDKELFSAKLSCAPLKAFESISECQQFQQEILNRLVIKEFCFFDTRNQQLRF